MATKINKSDAAIKSSQVEAMNPFAPQVPDLVCFTHLRWDFVFQRPQHLMTRWAREHRVFYVEEPVFDSNTPRLDITTRDCGVHVVVPHLPAGLQHAEYTALQEALIQDDLFLEFGVTDYILWYYTPMALAFTQHLEPLVLVYDCMDELSAFKNAPRDLPVLEADLLELADVVFTGGCSLYEARCKLHKNIHPFPSSIDANHFRSAREATEEPSDQASIPPVRLGFCGVIDERMNQQLIAEIADLRPDWQLVMIGPVVKIDPAELPQRRNIHYLGARAYEDLPQYFSGWQVAIMPFALNESTRFISPTKTPEYLAAGIPTISTSIRDVVHPYGQMGLVKIADTAAAFVAEAEYLMSPHFRRQNWIREVDEFLSLSSWDRTWSRMMQLINTAVRRRYPDFIDTEIMPAIQPVKKDKSAVFSPASGD